MAVKFIRMISFLFFFIFFNSQKGYGQDLSKLIVRCVFKDFTTQKSIPFVNIFNEKAKLISRSNDSGYAVIKLNQEINHIKISAVNIEDSLIHVAFLSSEKLNTIYLMPKSYELPEFVLNVSNSINGDSIWSIFLSRFNRGVKKNKERCLVQEHSITYFDGNFSDYREIIKSVNRDAFGFNDSRLVKARSVIDFKHESSELSWVNIDLLKLTESIGLHNFGEFVIETNPFKNFSDCMKMKVKSKFFKNNQLYFNFDFNSHPSCKNGLTGNVLINFSTGKVLEINYQLIPSRVAFESLSGNYAISDMLFNYSMEFDEKDGLCNLLSYSIKYAVVKENLKSPVVSKGQILLYFTDDEGFYNNYPGILKWRSLNDFQLMNEVKSLGNELPFMEEERFNFFNNSTSISAHKKSEIDSMRLLIEKEEILSKDNQLLFEPVDGYFGFNFIVADSLIAGFVFAAELQYLPNCQLKIKPILISSASSFLPKASLLKLQSCLENQIAEELIYMSTKINKLKIKKYDLLRSTYEVYIAKYIQKFNEGEKLSSACW